MTKKQSSHRELLFLQGEYSQNISACPEVQINYAVIIVDVSNKIVHIGNFFHILAFHIVAQLFGEAFQLAYFAVELAHYRIFKLETRLVHIAVTAFKRLVDRHKQLNSKYGLISCFNSFVNRKNNAAFLFQIQCVDICFNMLYERK